jgi:hypothetical protein
MLGSAPKREPNTARDTNALFAAKPATLLLSAVEQKKRASDAPYVVEVWERWLATANLIAVYPGLVPQLRFRFVANVPIIEKSYTPPISISIALHPQFVKLIADGLEKGHFLGPATIPNIKSILSPIQTSPSYLVPKPRKHEKMRHIQDFSHPCALPALGGGPLPVPLPNLTVLSINSRINIANFPCAWGSVWAAGLAIWSLPSNLEIAIWDIEAAYCTLQLAFSQWPGVAIWISAKLAVIDTCTTFGLVSSGGLFGLLADALCNILRYAGIGPLLKWVDNFMLACVKRERLAKVNGWCAKMRKHIKKRGHRRIEPIRGRGHVYWESPMLADGTVEEYIEDFCFELRDLTTGCMLTPADKNFAYTMEDIDRVCCELGIPWAIDKDLAFAFTNVYHRMLWNVRKQTVLLKEQTRVQYLENLCKWREKRKHMLEEVWRLAGRLQHVTYLVP